MSVAGRSFSSAMPEVSAVSVLPTCGTPEIVGVPVAFFTNTVELLVTRRSVNSAALLPATSAMTVPVAGTA